MNAVIGAATAIALITTSAVAQTTDQATPTPAMPAPAASAPVAPAPAAAPAPGHSPTATAPLTTAKTDRIVPRRSRTKMDSRYRQGTPILAGSNSSIRIDSDGQVLFERP